MIYDSIMMKQGVGEIENNEQNIHVISSTEKEIEELEEEEQHDYSNRLKTEQRYDFYQKETFFFRKLSGYLTDKKQELEIVYSL